MFRPNLTFFYEPDEKTIDWLFTTPNLIEQLQAADARLSLALPNLTPARAEAVRRLNKHNIPVVAWLLLPPATGYWFNADNLAAAAQRYSNFHRWSQQKRLKWAGIGLNFQPHLKESAFLRTHPLLTPLRLFHPQRIERAQVGYHTLVSQMQADGYLVESYIFPFIADERHARSKMLRALTGLVDVRVNCEVMMLYSTHLSHRDGSSLWAYGPDAQAIAVGITAEGPFRTARDPRPLLGRRELERDLRLASRWTNDIFIFDLPGCHRLGILSDLAGFDWQMPATPPPGQAGAQRIRQLLQLGLWLGSRPAVVLGSLAGAASLLWGGRWLWQRLRTGTAPETGI